MTAEKQVELLLGHLLRGTEFENKVFTVGGFVRDELLGLEPKDLDLVIEMDGGAQRL